MHNKQQSFLNHYFADIWKGDIAHYIYSGFSICDKISDNSAILDVGCGDNLFKARLQNVTGIDPGNKKADYLTSIEDYRSTDRYDVALCLGSINFGNEVIIKNQIKHVVDLLKPNARIFWRCNPGQQDHNNNECQEIKFFSWSFELLRQYADEYGFTVKNAAIDSNKVHQRLYCEWHR
jgi:hypothetical protein